MLDAAITPGLTKAAAPCGRSRDGFCYKVEFDLLAGLRPFWAFVDAHPSTARPVKGSDSKQCGAEHAYRAAGAHHASSVRSEHTASRTTRDNSAVRAVRTVEA